MGQVKKDWEDQVINKAEEIAQERYHVEFDALSPHMQMNVWMEAEHKVSDDLANEADMLCDRAKEGKLFRGGNGQGESYWDELELQRRLGK